MRRLPRDTQLIADLHEKARHFRDRLRAGGLDLGQSQSCIVPVLLGEVKRTLAVAKSLQDQGFDVRAVRPPTVPEGTARLRLTVRAAVAQADLLRAADALTALVSA